VRWEDSRLERPLAEISQNRQPPPVCAAAITQEITGKIWPAALGRVHVMAMAKLPRTEIGKLQRHRLGAAFQEQARIEKRPWRAARAIAGL